MIDHGVYCPMHERLLQNGEYSGPCDVFERFSFHILLKVTLSCSNILCIGIQSININQL